MKAEPLALQGSRPSVLHQAIQSSRTSSAPQGALSETVRSAWTEQAAKMSCLA